jgi:ABC-type transporter Mla subunit MlaD
MKPGKKLKGRPAKTEGRRTKKIDARFTEEEYRKIEELEKTLGLKKTELVRIRLLESSVNLVINAKELIRELDAAGAELGRSGNNINQLARHANILYKRGQLSPEVVTSFNELMTKYTRNQQALEKALRKILRAMGH